MNFRDSEYLVPVFDFDLLNMQLNTPLFIFVLVLLVMFCMNKLLFQPVLNTLQHRKDHLYDLREQARQQEAQIQKLEQNYQQELEGVRAQVAQLRQDGRRETQEAVQAILAEAHQQSQTELRGALAELELELEQAQARLHQTAETLSQKTAERILNL